MCSLPIAIITSSQNCTFPSQTIREVRLFLKIICEVLRQKISETFLKIKRSQPAIDFSIIKLEPLLNLN